MGLLVNAAIGALAGVVGSLLSVSVLGSGMAVPLGLLFALGGFFAAGSMLPDAPVLAAAGKRGAAKASEFEEASAAKAAKKAKKAAAEKAKKEAAELAKAEEAAAKAAAKKAAEKAKKKAAKKAPVVVESSEESEQSESEAEQVAEAAAPKSKSALKKAKAKAKAAAEKAEAEAAAKAAEKNAKKKNKKGAAAAATEAAPAAAAAAAPAAAKKPTAAEKAAAAAAAADLEGWETIESTKPTKSQQAKKAEGITSPAASGKKAGSIPSSERELTEELLIAVKFHHLIIGKEGETLAKLSKPGTRIDMPKRDSGSSKIQITGTPAAVAQTRNAIESLVERGFSNLTHPGTLSDDMTVEPNHVGLILGANGANLRAIQTATQTRINLPEKGSSSKKVTIVGEKEGVRAAKAALRQLVADGFSPLTHPTWVKVEMDFPADKMSILIGKKGQTIKSIQGDTKARINLPEKNTNSSTISVCGPADAVAKAEKQINKLLEPLEPLPEPEDLDMATDDAWGEQHTADGEDALW